MSRLTNIFVMKFSLAITHYNRYDMLLRSFEQVVDDPRISEVIISDDTSTDNSWDRLRETFGNNPKIYLHRNQTNIGMSLNKAKAVSSCIKGRVILLDSDNIIDASYLDAAEAVLKVPYDNTVIFCPEFARPNFDYRFWSGRTIDISNIKTFLENPMGECQLNTCNYIVDRDRYLKIYQYDPLIKETDTAHFAHLWLKSGGSFYIVPDMQYEHTVHSGSGWLQNATYNTQKSKELIYMIRNL